MSKTFKAAAEALDDLNNKPKGDKFSLPFMNLTRGLEVNNTDYAAEKKARNAYRAKTTMGTIFASLICIIIGMACGFLLMLIDPAYFTDGFVSFFSYAFTPSSLTHILFTAGPLLFTALSVAFCYKCGMFNIGASGQFTAGGMAAIVFALHFHLPWYLSLLLAMVFGALIGCLPGLFKALFNVNEVISAIMLNWIVLYLANLCVFNIPDLYDASRGKTYDIAVTAAEYPDVRLPVFSSENSDINLTLFLGIAIAIVLAIILYKTTFGYRLRAVGFSRDAARYAGINDKLFLVLAFAISGALAGIGGACNYLVGGITYTPQTTSVASQGFDGIPIALLANSNPIGTIFATLFISFLKIAGNGLQGVGSYDSEFVNVMIGIILYGSAFAFIFSRLLLRDHKKKKNKKDKGADGPSIQAGRKEEAKSC